MRQLEMWNNLEIAYLVFYLYHRISYRNIAKLLAREPYQVRTKARSLCREHDLNNEAGQVDTEKVRIEFSAFLWGHGLCWRTLSKEELAIIDMVCNFYPGCSDYFMTVW